MYLRGQDLLKMVSVWQIQCQTNYFAQRICFLFLRYSYTGVILPQVKTMQFFLELALLIMVISYPTGNEKQLIKLNSVHRQKYRKILLFLKFYFCGFFFCWFVLFFLCLVACLACSWGELSFCLNGTLRS